MRLNENQIPMHIENPIPVAKDELVESSIVEVDDPLDLGYDHGNIVAYEDDFSLPIRLTPMTATCRVPPLSRVKLGIGWSRGVARDAEQ